MMQKGELATWVGIVLSGKLGAVIDGRTVGHMGVGSVVGEVAFFVGGLRQADVQGAEKGFIGVMMTAQAQVQTRHVKARAERAEEKVAGTAQRLAAERSRHRGVAAGTADMLDRVAQIEASFGSLLKPAADCLGCLSRGFSVAAALDDP